jgi:hypothetical protein
LPVIGLQDRIFIRQTCAATGETPVLLKKSSLDIKAQDGHPWALVAQLLRFMFAPCASHRFIA